MTTSLRGIFVRLINRVINNDNKYLDLILQAPSKAHHLISNTGIANDKG